MKSLCLLIFSFLFFVQYGFAQKSEENAAILNVMSTQEKAWNEGNLNSFMQTYWNNDSLAFVGSKGITYGWKNVLKNYQKNYTDTVKMGKLHFAIVKIDLIGETNAFVIGAWHLKRSVGDIGGHFTLLFRKIGGQWQITVDHTS